VEQATDSPATPAARSSRARRIAWRMTRSLLFIYLGVTLGCSMLQEWMIFPGASSKGQAYSVVKPSADEELVPLKTRDGDSIYVLFGKSLDSNGRISEDSGARPTLIFFYGNAMCLADAQDICRSWRKLGANVVGVEYPGYGMSSGKPSETNFYAAADAAYDWVAQRGDLDKTKIVPAGLSIGTGPAVDLASRKPSAALVIISPYTSLDDLARRVMPLLPTGLILRHHFRNEEKIGSLKVPILIAHGRRDSIIPFEMSEKLASAAKGSPQVTTVFVDTDHNDLFQLAQDEVDVALKDLINQLAAPR
jgi:uncharacterized protein